MFSKKKLKHCLTPHCFRVHLKTRIFETIEKSFEGAIDIQISSIGKIWEVDFLNPPDIGFFHRINLYFYPDIGWEAFFHCKYKYWVSSHRPLTRPPHHPYLIFVTNITSGIGGDKSVMWRHFRFLYLAMWRNLNT